MQRMGQRMGQRPGSKQCVQVCVQELGPCTRLYGLEWEGECEVGVVSGVLWRIPRHICSVSWRLVLFEYSRVLRYALNLMACFVTECSTVSPCSSECEGYPGGTGETRINGVVGRDAGRICTTRWLARDGHALR